MITFLHLSISVWFPYITSIAYSCIVPLYASRLYGKVLDETGTFIAREIHNTIKIMC